MAITVAINFVAIVFAKRIVWHNTFTSSNKSYDSVFPITKFFFFLFSSHLKLFGDENIEHTKANLEHTRLGLGDSNNNQFFFQQCQAKNASASCINIGMLPMNSTDSNGCFNGKIAPTESRDHKYGPKEPLLTADSRQNHVIISKTNNLMPKFLDNILKFTSKYSLDQKSSPDQAKSKH